MNYQIKDILGQIKQTAKGLKQGVRIADDVQRASGANIEGGLGYGQSILDPRFKQGIGQAGVTLKQTPAQFVGAYTSRLLVDAAKRS